MIEAGVEHGLLRVKLWRLFEEAHLQVVAEYDIARIVALLSCEDGEQRRLTRTVLRNQSYPLTGANGETDVVEQLQGAKRLREVLYV